MIPSTRFFEAFYDSEIGQDTKADLSQVMADLWSVRAPECLCGIGYLAPYRDAFAAPLFDLTPCGFNGLNEGLGVEDLGVNTLDAALLDTTCASVSRRAVVRETALPLPDESLDRLLIIHGLEFTPDPLRFLRESWRVLKSEGSLLIVAPNRMGLWARADDTPFGQGRPYSLVQLQNLLAESMFIAQSHRRALWGPARRTKIRKTMGGLMSRWLRQLSGVIIISAEKQTHRPALVRDSRGHTPRSSLLYPSPQWETD